MVVPRLSRQKQLNKTDTPFDESPRDQTAAFIFSGFFIIQTVHFVSRPVSFETSKASWAEVRSARQVHNLQFWLPDHFRPEIAWHAVGSMSAGNQGLAAGDVPADVLEAAN